jgi:hypothetical protein
MSPHITQLEETLKNMETSIQRSEGKRKKYMLAIARMENMLEDEEAAFESEVSDRRVLEVELCFKMASSVGEKLSVDEEIRALKGAAKEFEIGRLFLAAWWIRRRVHSFEAMKAQSGGGTGTGPGFEAS